MEVEKFIEKRIYAIDYKTIKGVLGLDITWAVEHIQTIDNMLSVTVYRRVDRVASVPETV